MLLPPSEGKTSADHGPCLDLAALTYPQLSDIREQVLAALIATSAGGPGALGLKDSMAAQVRANTGLRQAPSAPAASVYSGVLYEAADLAGLAGGARERADAHIRIASALFGMLAPGDPIPGYRLPPTAALIGLGSPLAALAPQVRSVMDADLGDGGLVLDCRSGAYTRLWRPRRELEWVTTRVVQLRAGVPTVVSHFAKYTRGQLIGHLLRRSAALPTTVAEIADAAAELIGHGLTDISLSRERGNNHVLELVLSPRE